jgi:hypothetical protein
MGTIVIRESREKNEAFSDWNWQILRNFLAQFVPHNQPEQILR